MRIRGIIFDKDGTLLRFGETWNVWCEQCLTQLAAGDTFLREAIAEAIDYDLVTCSFRPQSENLCIGFHSAILTLHAVGG